MVRDWTRVAMPRNALNYDSSDNGLCIYHESTFNLSDASDHK
jgi:hypothetical protein